MYQHPLIPLILSVILIVMFIKQCITRKKFLKYRVLLSFFIAFICTIFFVFNNELTAYEQGKEVLNWSLIGLDIFMGILFILFSELSNSREQFNLDLFKTLDQTKLYLLIDKKNRIKDISSLLLQELGIENKEEVLRKNCFDIIESKFSIHRINNTEFTMEDLNITFQDSKQGDGKLTLELRDEHGDIFAYNFNQTPIIVLGRFRGRILVGDKLDAEHLVGMEQNLAESIEELELIKSRFLTILEKSIDGIFFKDIKQNTVWLNDVLVKKMGLSDNHISLDEFYNKIHPNELAYYQEKLAQVDNLHPDYSITYRLAFGHKYVYVKEEGSRISSGHSIEYCGIMDISEDLKFEKTNTLLDQILGEDELNEKLDQLFGAKNTFEIVRINIASIPEINEKYGRVIGNMALSSYIRFFKKRYITEEMLYRISGLEFIAIITDLNKMELLKKDLQGNERILHLSADYGKNKIMIHSYMGICYSSECANSKDALSKVKECLRFSSNPQYKNSYAYYKDIQ